MTSTVKKTIEANVTVTPIPAFSVGLTGYFGNESTNPTIALAI